jgi:hypothetical protein
VNNCNIPSKQQPYNHDSFSKYWELPQPYSHDHFSKISRTFCASRK